MSIAAYNRGSRAISEHITDGLRKLAESIPSLPAGWMIDIGTNVISVRDQIGRLVHREPRPYRGRIDCERIAQRAIDPVLRGICSPDGGHALNGWQLHF